MKAMGISEWGFHIFSEDNLQRVLDLIKRHNDLPDDQARGENLKVHAIIKDNAFSRYFLCVGNGGGRDATSKFIRDNYVDGEVFHPFEKPVWWNDPEEYTFFWKGPGSFSSPFTGEYIFPTP